MNVKFYMPTKVIMSGKCLKNSPDLFKESGDRALIITGKSSAKKNGALDDVENLFKDLNIKFRHYNSIEPNPTIETVMQIAEDAREFKPDFVVGIGGGSALDAAKAISILTINNIDKEQLFSGKYDKVLPVIAVPTTTGSGSEVTPYAIITDTEMKKKRGIVSEKIFPKQAFLDVRYSSFQNFDLTIETTLDALSHAVEGYLSVKSNPLSDSLAVESIKMIGSVIKKLGKSALGKDEREKLLYASMLAGQVIAQTGTTMLHAMGYSLTTHKGVAHGRANALLFSEYLKYINETRESKVENIYYLLGLKSEEKFKQLMESLVTTDLELSEAECAEFAAQAILEKNISNTDPEPDKEALLKIYRNIFLKN